MMQLKYINGPAGKSKTNRNKTGESEENGFHRTTPRRFAERVSADCVFRVRDRI